MGLDPNFLAELAPMGRIGAIVDVADAVPFHESAPSVDGEGLHVDGAPDAGQD